MKKNKIQQLITGLLFIVIAASCEEVVQIEVPVGEPKLVIEAIFEVYFDESPVTAKTEVRLTTSAPYFDENIPLASNATVFVTNLEDNTVINFSDTNNRGTFSPVNSFIPQDNVNYELTVIYENETYKATQIKQKTPVLTSVVQGEKTLFSGEETELKVRFTDDALQENFYIFDFDNNEYNALEDRFFNGSDYEFSSFYQEDEIELPTTVTVKIASATEDYYQFFRVVLNQSGQGGGGPFSTVPASLLGNIVNKTNFKNFPLGYFHIAEVDRVDVSLVEK